MKRHGHVVAQLDNGEIVSGIVNSHDSLYYLMVDGFVKIVLPIHYTILKDLRSEFYAGQECEFWDDSYHGRIREKYLVQYNRKHLDGSGSFWNNCEDVDVTSEIKAEIEQKRKELAYLEAKLKQEK